MFSELKIGDFAQLNSISVQALRHYEKLGLIVPQRIDPLTHYRYYNIEQSANIDVIQFLQSLNFSLATIQQMLQAEDNFSLLEQLIAGKHQQLVAEKIRLEEQLTTIKDFQESMTFYEQNQDKTALELVTLPQRYILSFPLARNIYTMTMGEYEYALREFKQLLVQQGFASGDFHRVGTLMRRQDFEEERFNSQQMFIFLPHKPQTQTKASVEKLPKGLYAVYYCRSFQEELASLKRFKRMIKEQGLRLAGDYICEVVYELPKLNTHQRKMFIRLQVPVILP